MFKENSFSPFVFIAQQVSETAPKEAKEGTDRFNENRQRLHFLILFTYLIYLFIYLFIFLFYFFIFFHKFLLLNSLPPRA